MSWAGAPKKPRLKSTATSLGNKISSWASVQVPQPSSLKEPRPPTNNSVPPAHRALKKKKLHEFRRARGDCLSTETSFINGMKTETGCQYAMNVIKLQKIFTFLQG